MLLDRRWNEALVRQDGCGRWHRRIKGLATCLFACLNAGEGMPCLWYWSLVPDNLETQTQLLQGGRTTGCGILVGVAGEKRLITGAFVGYPRGQTYHLV